MSGPLHVTITEWRGLTDTTKPNTISLIQSDSEFLIESNRQFKLMQTQCHTFLVGFFSERFHFLKIYLQHVSSMYLPILLSVLK